ncbi:MAG: restriction endonuclease [Verrucomicrobia bacterium]|nr:restriction endonuclease [Verrucomicrobiota bacterium]
MNTTTPLGQVVDVSAGQPAPKPNEFSEEGYPFIRAGSLQSLLNGGSEQDCEKIDQETAEKKRFRLYPKDTILFAKSGMSAKIGRVYRLDEPSFVVSHLAALTPTGKYDPNFLTYWLRKNSPSKLIKDDAYPSIRIPDIANLKVPDLELDEQRWIAAILDKADTIRRKREQALALADDFLRSLFLDMFGDPLTNPKKFPVGTIRDLVSEVCYGTSQRASVDEGELPILRMGNITYEGDWKLTDLKYINIPDKDRDKYTVHKDDILFNRTNSKELVGKTAVFDRDDEFAFAGYLVRARVNNLADPYYISAYMNSSHGKLTLQSMCKSIVGMANINAQEFQNIKICIPPIGLQRDYRRFVDSVAQKKEVLDNALSDAKILFTSLSQRAFRGEL